MRKFHLPFGIGKHVGVCSEYVTQEEYKELMNYAKQRGVKLEGFKRFSGNISLIKEMVDDITEISIDFPKLTKSKKSIVISYDENSNDDDFATAIGHIVYINARIFNNWDYLKAEYQMVAEHGHFVKGTDYRSVIRHEAGHVVAQLYGIDSMNIAKEILPGKSLAEIIEIVKNELSLYAADYEDGREFISESFSAYYSNSGISFAEQFVERCKNIVKEES